MRKPHQISPGARIGRWVVRSRLGRGAIATVYRAEEIGTQTQVALKVLHNDRHDAEGTAVDRLRREVKLAGRINHPGVCRPLELFEDGELVLLAMQVVPGRSLQEILDREQKLQVARAVRVVRRVCDALAATHALGILHRDLKPGNIMVRPDGEPTVLDFGYAVAPDVTRVTRSGVWVGTLAFAAPELLKNEPATPQSDIYSLGVILYQCLTGELPFVGKTYGEVASAVLYEDPCPPRVHAPEISPRLEATVLRTLSRDPACRFLGATALADALAADDVAEVRSGASSAQMEERTETGVHLPGIAAAEATEPSVRAPSLQAGEATEPSVRAPSLQAGEATEPSVRAPSLQAGEATEPSVRAPSLQAGEATEPSVRAPSLQAGEATEPRVPLPRQSVEPPEPNGAPPPVGAVSGVPQVPPERTPVNVAEGFIRVRQQLAELSAALVRERSDKGLIAGDNRTLDQLEKRAEQELGQVKMVGTLDLLSRALEVARAVPIDEAFVAAKLERLVEALGRAAARSATRCRPHLDQARAAFDAGDYGAANRALNLGFEAIKPR